MNVDVLYFGVLKDRFGHERDRLELPAQATVATLMAQLNSRMEGLDSLWGALAVAVNRVYASSATTLADGDEVALLPPVSGGSHAH